MREHIVNVPENYKPTEKEIENGKVGFEQMAQRLNELWQKDDKNLTPEEKAEIDLIFNNAMVLDELIRGELPAEIK